MPITPDHISEKMRIIIRSASDAALARQLHRANRAHRLALILLAVAIAWLVFALVTRTAESWTVFSPLFLMVAIRRQSEKDEHIADVMKIALHPAVINEIRQDGDREA